MPKYLLFIFLVYNAVFMPVCHVKTVLDERDISPKMFPSDCITLYENAYSLEINFIFCYCYVLHFFNYAFSSINLKFKIL